MFRPDYIHKLYFPRFEGQIEKRNFVEKGKQNYGTKESSPNL